MQVLSGPVGREKIHYEAPPGNRVEKELKLFLEWWQRDKFKLDGILRAAIAGFWFVSNEPFGQKISFYLEFSNLVVQLIDLLNPERKEKVRETGA